MFDLSRLSIRDHGHTQANYHKHIEGGTAHYGAWAELPCIKVVPTHLSKDKKDRVYLFQAKINMQIQVQFAGL